MSMLRNVLTYMGLGPDEDYDDGYLYEASADRDIDLTDLAHDDADGDDLSGGFTTSFGRGRTGDDGSDPADHVDADRADDLHAQRERPDWLAETSTNLDDKGGSSASARRRIAIDDDDPERAGRHEADSSPSKGRSRGRHDRNTQPSVKRGRHDRESVRPLRAVPPAELEDGPDDGITVRSVPPLPKSNDEPVTTYAKPRTLSPKSFGDAKTLADEFKESIPVVMNLQGIERELARRLIDFASGICYALDGGMEKLAPQVFLLTPKLVDVTDEDRRRLQQRGYES